MRREFKRLIFFLLTVYHGNRINFLYCIILCNLCLSSKVSRKTSALHVLWSVLGQKHTPPPPESCRKAPTPPYFCSPSKKSPTTRPRHLGCTMGGGGAFALEPILIHAKQWLLLKLRLCFNIQRRRGVVIRVWERGCHGGSIRTPIWPFTIMIMHLT